MVGDPAALIIDNAWAFGARGFDARAALDLIKRNATRPKARCNRHAVRPGQAFYNDLGYLPAGAPDVGWGPTSTTLEYGAADFANAQFARAVGDNPAGQTFLKRARQWHNLFNPQTGYVQPRDKNGEWKPDFDPSSTEFYVEGNAAQYTFAVPYDVTGLVRSLGGTERALARLDALFTQLNAGVDRPYFYMGNEPQFATPWLYDFMGAPAKTQETVRHIVTRLFTDHPDGLPGNDDMGALSSWYVWAVLGLYPVVPGVGGFAVGSPLFPFVAVTLPNGQRIQITGDGAAPEAPFVQGLTVNGKAWDVPWIPLELLSHGARLDFALASQANRSNHPWGQNPVPAVGLPGEAR